MAIAKSRFPHFLSLERTSADTLRMLFQPEKTSKSRARSELDHQERKTRLESLLRIDFVDASEISTSRISREVLDFQLLRRFYTKANLEQAETERGSQPIIDDKTSD